jgi:hypothetical protein
MANNRFKRGSGVFECSECGRRTRDTGNYEHESGMCKWCVKVNECWNGHSDGAHDYEGSETHKFCMWCAHPERDDISYAEAGEYMKSYYAARGR